MTCVPASVDFFLIADNLQSLIGSDCLRHSRQAVFHLRPVRRSLLHHQDFNGGNVHRGSLGLP